jgi:hypothetical protein
LGTVVFDFLGDSVDPRRFVEVPRTIEEEKFNARGFRESSSALDAYQKFRLVDQSKNSRC